MKKSLIALAVMAAAGAASAQSSVTLFGIVDVALSWGRGSVADRFQVTRNGYNSSRLGFRGVEDLGGGMSASFWLESDFQSDDGLGANTNTNNQTTGQPAPGAVAAGSQGLTFNRRSTVSLGGNWGELRLGRDYVPQFWNRTVFDPFGTLGVGASQVQAGAGALLGVTAVRASNSIGYFFPRNLGGFYGQVMYHEGENPSNAGATEDDGDGYGLRVGFASGPFNVAFGWGRVEYAAGDTRAMNLGGQWDFGMAKLMGYISRDRAGTTDGRGWLIGSLIPVGPGEIRVSYSQYRTEPGGGAAEPRTRKLALGYVHNLSKRTALYTTYARARNDNGAATALGGATTAVNSSSSGLDIGIRHSF